MPEPVTVSVTAFLRSRGFAVMTNAAPAAPPPNPRAVEQLRATVANAVKPSFLDAGQRVVRKERMALARAAAKHADDATAFAGWRTEFYEQLRAYAAEAFRPCALALEGLGAEDGAVTEATAKWAAELWPDPAAHAQSVLTGRGGAEGTEAGALAEAAHATALRAAAGE